MIYEKLQAVGARSKKRLTGMLMMKEAHSGVVKKGLAPHLQTMMTTSSHPHVHGPSVYHQSSDQNPTREGTIRHSHRRDVMEKREGPGTEAIVEDVDEVPRWRLMMTQNRLW